MTDGTSQGLFIVVAIVIFGIFVVLAYTLFEDTLSPAMASMFTTATETSSDRLGNNKLNIEDYNFVYPDKSHIVLDFKRVYEDTGASVHGYNGISGDIPSVGDVFEFDDMRVLNGKRTLHGKLDRVYVSIPTSLEDEHPFTHGKLFINGKDVTKGFEEGYSPSETQLNFFVWLNPYEFELGKTYQLKYKLYQEDGKYVEFLKKIAIK